MLGSLVDAGILDVFGFNSTFDTIAGLTASEDGVEESGDLTEEPAPVAKADSFVLGSSFESAIGKPFAWAKRAISGPHGFRLTIPAVSLNLCTMGHTTTKEPELEHGDYIRYERGTAPLDPANKKRRDRADYKTRFEKPTKEQKEHWSRIAAQAKKPSPIAVKLADQEAIKDREEKRDRREVPFTLAFRSIEVADFNFILNAWMMSYRDSRRDHTNGDYFHGQQNLIAEISQRRNMVLGVDAEVPEWIAGFVCGQMLKDGRLLLDYIYVKQAYRERGIARGLLGAIGWTPETEIIATHWTKQIEKVGRRYGATHNAYFNTMGFSDV